MACCAALAVVLGALRSIWVRAFPGRRPTEPGFAPPARRSADGTAPATATANTPGTTSAVVPAGRPTIAGNALLGVAYGAAAYALLVTFLCATPLLQVPDGPWLWRDAGLVLLAGLALGGGLALRTTHSRPAVLLGVGAAWTELGLVDMHLLGLFDFRIAVLPLDLAFHGSGLLLLVLVAPRLVAPRLTAAPTLAKASPS